MGDQQFVPNGFTAALAEKPLPDDRENSAADQNIKECRINEQVSQMIRFNQRFDDDQLIKRAEERGHEQMNEKAEPKHLAAGEMFTPKRFHVDQERNILRRLFSKFRKNPGNGGNDPGGKGKKDGGDDGHKKLTDNL